MNPIKKLASETAIYGVSSILGRVINFLLIWLHTSVFQSGEFGVVTEIYAYASVANVIFTYGMETSFFRFSTKYKDPNYYNFACTSILFSSTALSVVLFLNAESVTSFLGYSQEIITYVKWMSIIFWIDAVIAIPFAKLRIENKPIKFAVAKLSVILVTISLQVFFLFLLPGIQSGDFLQFFQPNIGFYNPSLGVGYVFLANLIGSSTVFLFLWKEVFSIRLMFNWEKFKPMLWYAMPILITGLAGMLNEQFDKMILKRLIPDGFYDGINQQDALGIYGAVFKLSVLMTVGIQAFRFAAEPFFFSKAEDKNSPELFAKVLHYFFLASLVVLVGVSLNLNLIGDLLLKREIFRTGLHVVPYLLVGKLFFGVYVNLSIWYKLTDRTIYGAYITVFGTIMLIASDLLLIPIYGYFGAAIASIPCYLSMTVICYFLGRKYFPVPYNFKPLLLHFILAIFLIIVVNTIVDLQESNGILLGLIATLVYSSFIWFSSFKNLRDTKI